MTIEWLLPAAMGAGLAGYGLRRLHLLKSAANWDRVPARVVSAAVVEYGGDGYDLFQPVVRFEADFGGTLVRSDRFSLDAADYVGDRRIVEKFVSPYTVGSEFDAYLDPRPGHAPMARADAPPKRLAHYWICVVCGFALIVIAALGIAYL